MASLSDLDLLCPVQRGSWSAAAAAAAAASCSGCSTSWLGSIPTGDDADDVGAAAAAGAGAGFAAIGERTPLLQRLCSSSSSWPIKFRLGEMMGRATFTSLYASGSDSDL